MSEVCGFCKKPFNSDHFCKKCDLCGYCCVCNVTKVELGKGTHMGTSIDEFCEEK